MSASRSISATISSVSAPANCFTAHLTLSRMSSRASTFTACRRRATYNSSNSCARNDHGSWIMTVRPVPVFHGRGAAILCRRSRCPFRFMTTAALLRSRSIVCSSLTSLSSSSLSSVACFVGSSPVFLLMRSVSCWHHDCNSLTSVPKSDDVVGCNRRRTSMSRWASCTACRRSAASFVWFVSSMRRRSRASARRRANRYRTKHCSRTTFSICRAVSASDVKYGRGTTSRSPLVSSTNPGRSICVPHSRCAWIDLEITFTVCVSRCRQSSGGAPRPVGFTIRAVWHDALWNTCPVRRCANPPRNGLASGGARSIATRIVYGFVPSPGSWRTSTKSARGATGACAAAARYSMRTWIVTRSTPLDRYLSRVLPSVRSLPCSWRTSWSAGRRMRWAIAERSAAIGSRNGNDCWTWMPSGTTTNSTWTWDASDCMCGGSTTSGRAATSPSIVSAPSPSYAS